MPAGESGTAYSRSPRHASETRHFDHPHKVMLGLYIGAFLAQFVFVIAYGIWWCLQGRGASDKNKRN